MCGDVLPALCVGTSVSRKIQVSAVIRTSELDFQRLLGHHDVAMRSRFEWCSILYSFGILWWAIALHRANPEGGHSNCSLSISQ